jgi:hypothetical protein
MWWEPRGESEASLAGAVRQLQGWYREQISREQPVAWGVGSAWSFLTGQLEPFVLLNREMFDRERFDDSLGRPFPIPIELFQAAFPRLFGSGEFNPLQQLPRFGSSLQLHAMAVGRPRPSAAGLLPNRYLAFTDTIICRQTGAEGTAAVKVVDATTGEAGLLTAGHVFPRGKGSRVDRSRRTFWRLHRREELGYVSHHIAPSGRTPSWDAAVIRFSKPSSFAWAGPVVNMLRYLKEPVSVVAYGATSGAVRQAAIVQGALVEGGAGEVHWINCWMIGPTGVLASGDSGAAVFARTGEFMGLYVGCSYFEDTDAVLTHFVQDAFTLSTEVLAGWQVHF